MNERQRVRILVVDDEREIAAGVTRALEALGYEVVGTCHDASEALVRARATHPNLAIVDVRLHGEQSGIQLASVLRTELGVLVIFLTAFADDAMLEKAARSAAAACLLKPVTDRDLRTAVETALSRHRTLTRESATERAIAAASVASGIAHEINNPLALVKTNVEFALEALETARRDPKSLSEAKLKQLLGALTDAKEGADRVRAVVSEMTTLAEEKIPAPNAVDMNGVLDAAWAIACGDAPDRRHWRYHVGTLPPIEGDEVQLVQLFTHLLQNAVQYRRTDGTHEVSLTAQPSGDGVEVIIADTGPGIAKELQSRVFDPFFTTRGAKAGRGLGMTIAGAITRAHLGEITIDSDLGVGTRIRVWLPRELRSARSQGAPSPSPVVSKAKPRVLVVDDEPAIGRSIQRMLKGDYDVRIAGDGPEALAALSSTRFDAILCDVTLPGMEGTELYTEIERRHPLLAPRVVFVTGGTFSRKSQVFLDSLANKTIRKPFAAEEIRSALREVLAR